MYKRIGIVIKANSSTKNDAVAQILATLQSLGCTVFCEPNAQLNVPCLLHYPEFTITTQLDVLLTIGGDGTIIRAARDYAVMNCPLITIHQGTIGFLAEINIEDVPQILPLLLQGNGTLEQRSLLAATIVSNGTEFTLPSALNEVVISQGAIARLFDMHVEIDGDILANYQADGLLIATPTGSTAYNLSAGGPIVHPAMQATIVTPINPYSLSQKPIVIPAAKHLMITPTIQAEQEIYVTIDGQSSHSMQPGDILQVQLAPNWITFLRCKEDTFFHTLRTKLKWAERIIG